MRFLTPVLIIGALGIALGGVPAMAASSVDTSASATTSVIASSPGTAGHANSSSTANSFSQSGNLNTGTNFTTSGELPSTSNPLVSPEATQQQVQGDLEYDKYLPDGPSLNGPGSATWCVARSSCSSAANTCSSACNNNVLVTSNAAAASAQTFPNVQLTNLSADECVASCHASYSSCEYQVARNCELSE